MLRSSVSDMWSPVGSSINRTQALTEALTHSHSKKGREYVARPSLLTELLQVSHIGSLYNLFVAILCILLLSNLLQDLLETGTVNLNLTALMWCFGGLEYVLCIWLGMFVTSSVGVYAGLYVWTRRRHLHPATFDFVFATMFLLYLCTLVYLPTAYMLHYQLPIASSFIVLCEQSRLFMKTWAFVRSNIWKGLAGTNNKKSESGAEEKTPENYVSHKDGLRQRTNIPRIRNDPNNNSEKINEEQNSSMEKSHACPDFSDYLYFHFAPTLVYRDSYPKNERVRWRAVVTDLCQVVGCVFYAYFLITRFCVPLFRQFGSTSTPSASQMVVSVFICCFPAFLVLLVTFFAVLHAWMNAFAEMTTFADRMFYKDWWNSSSFSRYYRTWNCVVHDWLYEYIYLETRRIAPAVRLRSLLPVLLTFFVSCVVHEYILALAFRFFYPVLLIQFGFFGVALMFINTRARAFNVFLWASLILGPGILMCLYGQEWYARANCAPVTDDFTDLLIPRSWNCVPLAQ